jgi:hypothetical protein
MRLALDQGPSKGLPTASANTSAAISAVRGWRTEHAARALKLLFQNAARKHEARYLRLKQLLLQVAAEAPMRLVVVASLAHAICPELPNVVECLPSSKLT